MKGDFEKKWPIIEYINSKNESQVNVQWNKAVRRIPMILYTTHVRLLPQILNSLSFKDQDARRVKKFLTL